MSLRVQTSRDYILKGLKLVFKKIMKGVTLKKIKDEIPNLISAYSPNVWVISGCTHKEKTLHPFSMALDAFWLIRLVLWTLLGWRPTYSTTLAMLKCSKWFLMSHSNTSASPGSATLFSWLEPLKNILLLLLHQPMSLQLQQKIHHCNSGDSIFHEDCLPWVPHPIYLKDEVMVAALVVLGPCFQCLCFIYFSLYFFNRYFSLYLWVISVIMRLWPVHEMYFFPS